jgi:SpoVK/Ycf46/Vps4 family AAA+-type ATPase
MPITPRLIEMIAQAGIDPRHYLSNNDAITDINNLMARAQRDPQSLVVDVLRERRESERAKQACAKAAEAAEKLEQMFSELLSGNVTLYRLEGLRAGPDGPHAVCRSGNQVQSFPLHPEMDVQRLTTLQPWGYVLVREKVAVGTWCDDDCLFDAAQGEVVNFKGFANPQRHLVRVSRHGYGEELVTLADPLRGQKLTGQSKLVLQRDNPRFAIASLPADRPESQFEVSIDRIHTTLSDLAGVEQLTEKLVLDVAKRILFTRIREEYALRPLRGMLLLSYKPGMGKTAFMRAFARWLHEWGEQIGFDVVLYIVPPNSTKSMWHGEDGRIMREDIFGAIRARRDLPRERPLFQLLVMDEVDALGRRPEAHDRIVSAAQSDAVQTFLAEMDGMLQEAPTDPPAHLLVVGMSNRPDLIDIATKRPGRLGDLVIEMPDIDCRSAEEICAVYARHASIPFQLNGKPATGVELHRVRDKLIRPALARVFPAVVLRYASDTQRTFDVTAGQILAATHYEAAMNNAKNRAADRRVLGTGSPAICYDDVVGSLWDVATSAAAAMQADPLMLVRELQIKMPVTRVEAVPRAELETHPYVREAGG